MGYAERIRAVARRQAAHFQPSTSATLKDRNPGSLDTSDLTVGGGSTTTYTVNDCMILSAQEFFARAKTMTQVGDLIVQIPRDSDAWDTAATPAENWQVTIDSRTGIVRKVHTKVAVWLLECAES